MKRHLLVLAALTASLIATPATAAATEGCDATYHTEVTARPDSGIHGTWATDTFTRTTSVTCDGNTYTLAISDSGTFVTEPGALSPAAGVELPAEPISGSFTGTATLKVTSDTPPQDPGATSDGTLSTSEWASLLFPGNNGTISGWSWTYATDCEQWVNAEAGNTGDITKTCPADEDTDTTTPTTSEPPASSSSTSTTSPAPAANVRGTKGEQEILAATGTGGTALPWLVVAGIVMLIAGGGSLFLVRRSNGGR